MFERFTDRARKSVVWAQEEARGLQHNYIGTEHLLLGLMREGEGVAAQALTSLGLALTGVRDAVTGRVGLGKTKPVGHIPFTPRAKKVLELALREALKLQHNFIGTEHVLLGLVTEGEGVAAQILMTAVDGGLDRIRNEVLGLIGASVETVEGRGRTFRRGPLGGALNVGRMQGIRIENPNEILVRLEAIEARLSAIERLLREAGGETEAS
jgi:ATP-dependent Clp protease ATP-binding subunit ClpC